MNYTKIYNALVDKAINLNRTKSNTSYYESHHIIPRSMGGSSEKSNLVLLTAREHFLSHKLLVKIHPDSWKMKFALFMMSQESTKSAKGVKINSNSYEKLKKEIVEIRKEFAFISDCIEFDFFGEEIVEWEVLEAFDLDQDEDVKIPVDLSEAAYYTQDIRKELLEQINHLSEEERSCQF